MRKQKSRLLRTPASQKPPHPNKPKLQAGRDKTTQQVAVMSEHDRVAHAAFVQAVVDDFRPRNFIERQIARRIADQNWRLNRLQAIEENIFAWGHSGPYANMEAEHPQIHHAMIQALTFIDDPRLFGLLSLYERRLTLNMQANVRMLLQLQSIPMPNREQSAPVAEIPEMARAASGDFVLQNDEKAA